MKIMCVYMLLIYLTTVCAFVCHYTCLTCSGTTKIDCLTCSEGSVNPAGKCSCSLPVYQDGVCQNACSQGYEQQGDQCQQCDGNCKTCFNSVCQSCYENYKIVDNSFCQPYCPAGSYFLSEKCVPLIASDDLQSEIVFYAFNEDKNSCEVDSTQLTFDPTFFSSGNSCTFFNNYLIFGSNYLWNSRKVSLFKENLKSHSSIRIFVKTFLVDQWNIGDRYFMTLDQEIVYDYNVTNMDLQLEQNIKLNISHIKQNLALSINVKNQIGTGYIGMSDLQIIVTCGCGTCDANGCVTENNQYITCLNNQTMIDKTCINCDSLPYRLSNCDCDQGYYLNNSTNQCFICQPNCLTCLYEDSYCTSCNLNYQSPPFCNCQFNVIKGTAYFSVQIPQIKITFEQNLIMHSSKCKNIFEDLTYTLLGESPLCLFEDKTISVVFGNNFQFIISDDIQLNSENFDQVICQTPIKAIKIDNKIAETVIPQLYLSTSKLVMSEMSSEIIYYYTKEQLNSLQWSMLEYKNGFDTIQELVNQWNELIFKQQSFPVNGDLFKEQNQIILQLKFCNFLQVCGQVKLNLIVQLNFDRFLHILVEYQRNQIYKEPQLKFLVQAQLQIGSQLMVPSDQLNISYTFSGKMLKIQEQVNIDPSSFYIITIDSSDLTVFELYNLDIEVKSGNLTQYKKLQLFFEEQPIQVKIKGGNRVQSYQKQFSLSILKNNEELLETCNPFSQILWKCIDLSTSTYCRDSLNNPIILEQNNTILYIQQKLFTPYKVVEFILYAVSDKQAYNDSITIQFVEEDLPTLQISTNNKDIVNNCYDDIQFDISYSDSVINSDILDFKGMILLDYEILSYFVFNYTTFKVRLSNHYTLEEDKELHYRFAVYNPNYLIPSLYSISFGFNSPPQKCQLSLKTLIKFYLVTTENCVDSDLPLQYRFSVYLRDPSFEFYETNTNNRILLSDFTFNKSITTNLFGEQIILGVEVKDIHNGINNFISHFSINDTLNNQFSLPENDNTSIVYQMSYYLQYLVNQTSFLSKYQTQSLIKIQKEIKGTQIINPEIYYQNGLLLELLKQKDYQQTLTPNFDYWNTSIQLLQTDVQNLLEGQDQNQYFQQLEVDYRIFQMFQSLSYWLQIQESQSSNQNRRLLQNEQISEYIIQNIMEVSNQQLKMQLPNGQQQTKYTDFYNITTTKFTNNYVKTSKMNINVAPNTFVSKQLISFKDNIFKQEMDFQNIQNASFPLYSVQITSSNSSSQINEINGSLFYEFEVDDENQYYQCAIKTKEGWDLSECNSTKKNYQVICECTKVGSTTIVQVFINFQKNILNLFTESNFERIQSQNYFLAVFTYVEIIFALIFVWYLYFGNQLDINQKQQIVKTYPPQKVYPVNLNTGSNDILSTYSKQSSLKAFNYNPHNLIPIIEANQTQNKAEQIMQSPKGSEKMEDAESNDHVIPSPKSGINQLIITEKTIQTGKQIVQFPSSFQNNFGQETDKLSKFLMFYKNYHKILALYYRYDEKSSRPVRVTLLYLSILGQMSVVNWFGEVFDVVIMLILSLITYAFGLLFKRILAFFLMSKYFLLQYIGNVIATLSAIFFIFVTISSIPLYRNTLACNLWALGFITGIFIDFFVYTTIQILLMFIVLLLFTKKSLFRKIVRALLDPVCYSIVFSES